MNMKKIAVGIILLFIVTSVSPLVVGYSSNNSGSEYEELLDNLAFMCYDENSGNEKYEYYKKYVLNDCSNNDLDVVEVVKPVESSTVSPSKGPMDSPWPMFGHDVRHTGQSPYSTADNPGIEKWRFYNDHWMDCSPIMDNNGIIYISDTWGHLNAINPNGSFKWEYVFDGQVIGSSPAIDENGTIYIGSWDCKLYAINPNGTNKWTVGTGGSISSSPAIADDGTIYIGNLGNHICAINPNGTMKWQYTTGYKVTSDPAIGEDGTVYIGSGDSYLYAMYPNGTLRWRFNTGGEIHGHPSIAEDGTIYIGSWDDYLYALYPNGTLKWSFHTEWGTSNNQAIGNDGTIYVGTDKLYALYPNATMRWEFNLGSNRWIGKSSPAISADGTIYIGTQIGDGAGGEIIAVNPNGTEKWRKRIADYWVDSSPSIGEDGTVYIGSAYDMSAGYLHAFGDGELICDAGGPYYGSAGSPIQFISTVFGGSPPYSYLWYFGDGETSEEANPSHSYDNQGIYNITLEVTDIEFNTSLDTSWTLVNDPPSKPSISGEMNGGINHPYEYTFVSADPDGDNIYYTITWGDGHITDWFGPFASGEDVIVSHEWSEMGTYKIRARAIDTYDAMSEWGWIEVRMPINQPVQFPFISWLLERFPNMFPILRHTLQNWGVIV
jgi:large repetitive protein